VIARDILEHVTDITAVLLNINQYLKPGGYLHFITPNGHEDVWKHYLTAIFEGKPSQMLINHVNYYDGKGLKDLLAVKGFSPVDYYTFTFKTTFKGFGWKKSKRLMSPVSQISGPERFSASYFINEKAGEVSSIEFKREEILDQWYIRDRARWITYLYSWFQHSTIFRIRPEFNVGHEIYGLFRKVQSLT